MATTKKKTADGPQLENRPTAGDPLAVNARLYRQVSELLGQLETGEHITLKERIAALVALGRLQTIFLNLRLKGEKDEPTAGSKVRSYANTFAAHDARRRKEIARLAADADESGDDDLLGDEGEDRDTA